MSRRCAPQTTRSNRSCTVYSSFVPSPLSLPLTWQGSLPSPPLASESKQPLISQSNSGEATTGRRGQTNLHCKSTALQTGTRSPGRKACDQRRCPRGHTCTHTHTHKHAPSPREGSAPRSSACKARCSEHFRKGTSLNVFFDEVQALPADAQSYFSRCGCRAARGLATSRLPPSCSWAKYHADDSVRGVQLSFFPLSYGFLLNANLQVRQSRWKFQTDEMKHPREHPGSAKSCWVYCRYPRNTERGRCR